MFFRLVQFGDCSAFPFSFSMHSFFIPVGDESAYLDECLPEVLGIFLL